MPKLPPNTPPLTSKETGASQAGRSLPSHGQDEKLSSAITSLFKTYDAWGVSTWLADTPVSLKKTAIDGSPLATRQDQLKNSISETPELSETRSEASYAVASETLHPALLSLARTATRAVTPIIPPKAQFLLIGETPNADEDRSGKAFCGDIGALLDKVLASATLSRAHIALAPALPWRPPGGRPLSPVEIPPSQTLLEKIISQVSPAFIVTMGVTPIKLLLGEAAALSRIRGTWQTINVNDASYQMLPMRHPTQILTNSRARQDLWHDLLLLSRKLEESHLDL